MILDRWAPRSAIVSSPPPPRPLAPRTAQGFEGFEDAGQALFPGAAAFEAGFQGGQGQRAGGGGQHLGDGADLFGQGGGPGLDGGAGGGSSGGGASSVGGGRRCNGAIG